MDANPLSLPDPTRVQGYPARKA